MSDRGQIAALLMAAAVGVVFLFAWVLYWPFTDAGHPRLDATKNRTTRKVYFALATTAELLLIVAFAFAISR